MPLIEMIVYGIMLAGAIRATWEWKQRVRQKMSSQLTVPFTIQLRNTRPPGADGDQSGEQTEW